MRPELNNVRLVWVGAAHLQHTCCLGLRWWWMDFCNT